MTGNDMQQRFLAVCAVRGWRLKPSGHEDASESSFSEQIYEHLSMADIKNIAISEKCTIVPLPWDENRPSHISILYASV